jgi:hypothetical protein
MLELIAVYSLVGVVAYLLRGRLAALDHAPVGWQLAVGSAVGALLVSLPFVQGLDVLPDSMEPVIFTAVAATLVVLVVASFARRR